MPTVQLSERCTRMVNATGVLRKAIVEGATTVILPSSGRMHCPWMAYNIPNGTTLIGGTISGGFRIPDSAWSAVTESDPNHANLPAGYSGIYVAALDQTIELGSWPTTYDSIGTLDVGLHVDGVPATRAASDWMVPTATSTTSQTFADPPSGLTADGGLMLQMFVAQEYDDNTFRTITSISTKTFSWSNAVAAFCGEVTFGSGHSSRGRFLNHPKLLLSNGQFWVDRTLRLVYYKSATAPTNTCVDTLPGNDTSGITGSVLQHNARSSGTLRDVRIESTRGSCYVAYNSSNLNLIGLTCVGGQRGFRLQSGGNDHANNTIINLTSKYHATNCAQIENGVYTSTTQRNNTVAGVNVSYPGLRSVKWGECISFKGYGLSPTGVVASQGPRIGIVFSVANATLNGASVSYVCQDTGDQGAIYFRGDDTITPEKYITNCTISHFGAPASIAGLYSNSKNGGIYGDNFASNWYATGNNISHGDYGMHSNSGHEFEFTGNTLSNIGTDRIQINQGGAIAGGDTGNASVFTIASAIRSAYQTISPKFYAKSASDATEYQKPSGIILTGNTSEADAGGTDSISTTWPTGNTEPYTI